MTKRTIEQSTVGGIVSGLVYSHQRSSWNSTGVTLSEGAKYRWSRPMAIYDFDQYLTVYISETRDIWLLWNDNSKLYV